jgi:argininosuccinate lyase
VAFAESNELELSEVSDVEFAAISKHLTPEVREVLNVAGSIRSRSGTGGTAVPRVLDQISALRKMVPSENR